MTETLKDVVYNPVSWDLSAKIYTDSKQPNY